MSSAAALQWQSPQESGLSPALAGAPITPETIKELAPRLLAFAHKLMRDSADAEDMVQEAWISALRSAHRFEGRSSVSTWLTTILRRRIADRYVRARTAEPLDEDTLGIHADSPEELLATCELAWHGREALAVLNEQEQRAITLCDLQDVDRDDACQALGVTRSHLRVLLYRGRQKLQRALAEQPT